MAYGMEIETFFGRQNVADIRSMRKVGLIVYDVAVEGLQSSGPLPSGISYLDVFPFVVSLNNAASPLVLFTSGNQYFFQGNPGTSGVYNINVMAFK